MRGNFHNFKVVFIRNVLCFRSRQTLLERCQDSVSLTWSYLQIWYETAQAWRWTLVSQLTIFSRPRNNKYNKFIWSPNIPDFSGNLHNLMMISLCGRYDHVNNVNDEMISDALLVSAVNLNHPTFIYSTLS